MGLGIAVVSRDSPSRESWMETQVDILARELFQKFFPMELDPGKSILDIDYGNRHGIAIRFNLA